MNGSALRTARLIAGALAGGVTLFAVIAWFIVQDGPIAAEGADPSLFAYAWIAVTFSALLVSIILWRTNVAPRTEAAARPREDDRARDSALLAGLIICWALAETPAMFGVVIYLVFGSTLTLVGGLLTIWLAIAFTWPRRHWFGA